MFDRRRFVGGSLAAQGHRVTVLYLTRGEKGLPGTPATEAAAIRTAEAEAACRLLGARALFAGQADGGVELSPARAAAFAALLSAEKPDVVLAQWPLDTHPDHQVTGQLALAAHRSQDGERIHRDHVEVMERFRGREAGVEAAEAFRRAVAAGGLPTP